MPPKSASFSDVRRIVLGFPGVEETTVHGAPSFKYRKKLLAWVPADKSAEPDSIAVRIPLAERAELMAGAPRIYYITQHYAAYPTVLARLRHLQPDALQDLLNTAWNFLKIKPAVSSRNSRY